MRTQSENGVSAKEVELEIFELGAHLEYAIADSLEFFVADGALEGGAMSKRQLFDDFELIGEVDIFEGRTVLEYSHADSFEVFVKGDALEGGAARKRHSLDDFEIIGESDTREDVALRECSHSEIRNVAVLTELSTHEMATLSERHTRNALKFGQSREVDVKEAPAEGLLIVPPNYSEIGAPQRELNRAMGEALIQQPVLQLQRTKLKSDKQSLNFVGGFDDPFLD